MADRDDFRAARHGRRLNRWLQAALALTLAIGLNVLATQPGMRWRADLTEDRRHSLAGESEALLAEMRGREPGGEASRATLALVEIPAETLDPAAERRLARLVDAIERSAAGWLRVARPGAGSGPALVELAARHGPLPPDAAVVVACGPRLRSLGVAEIGGLAEAGRLEEALMAALVEVADDRPLVAYAVRGHGELSPEDTSPSRGMSQLARQLRLANVDLRPLVLAGPVPRDAGLVIVAGPVAAFSPAEAELLRAYLHDRNGRVLLMIDGDRDHGLDAVLESWAVFSPEAEVREPDASRRLPDGDIAIRNLDEKLHPVAQVLADLDLPIVAGRIRPVQFDVGSAPDSTLAVWQMAYTSREAWGEADPRREPARFDPSRDFPGPLCVAVAAERQAGLGAGAGGTPAGRLVVIGSSDPATNARLARGGNRALLMQAVHWLGGRERRAAVPPRPLERFALTAAASQMGTLAWRLALPCLAVAAVGLAVSAWRRRN